MKFLYPVRSVFPSFIILTVSFSKIAWHPASHNCAMDKNDSDVNYGKIRANLADSGSPGIVKNASCVL